MRPICPLWRQVVMQMHRVLAPDGPHVSPFRATRPPSRDSTLADVPMYLHIEHAYVWQSNAQVGMDGQKGFGLAEHALERCRAAAEASTVRYLT